MGLLDRLKGEQQSDVGEEDFDGEYSIEFQGVTKAFGGGPAVLDAVDLGIRKGRLTMIMGPSGTGKSVALEHAIGLQRPDDGKIFVEGTLLNDLDDDELLALRKKKFGVLFQDGALFSSMNVFNNVAFPLRQNTDKSEEEIAEIVQQRLTEVGLRDAMTIWPNELSGGMRKRAGFARALATEPSIVLIDEPDSGLDPVRTALLCELIQELHEENGGTYLVITHDMLSARRIAEFIAVLWKGKVVQEGPADELLNSDDDFVRQFLSGETQGPLGMD